jgi:hypothetical protein
MDLAIKESNVYMVSIQEGSIFIRSDFGKLYHLPLDMRKSILDQCILELNKHGVKVDTYAFYLDNIILVSL